MRLQVKKVSDGPGPGEVVVEVTTMTGVVERIIVHVAGMVNDTIDVGYPLASSDEERLIELPRESTSGRWRLWVPQSAMVE